MLEYVAGVVLSSKIKNILDEVIYGDMGELWQKKKK